jgi:AAA ATPase domain
VVLIGATWIHRRGARRIRKSWDPARLQYLPPTDCSVDGARLQLNRWGIGHWLPEGNRVKVFGREPERGRIEQLLDSASTGPVGIALEGGPGIGKTTVWRDATERARDRAYRVLVAAPSEPDATLAFSGLGDLFESLEAELFDRLPDPQRRALRAALFLSDAGDAPADLDALPRAVFGVLRHLAAEATVLVAIDDEQWLDRPSARVLAFALRRIREEPICLLVSRRAGSNGALWPEVKDGFASAIACIELQGVELATTHRLLSGLLGSKISRRVLERVGAHDRDDLIDTQRVRRTAHALVARRTTPVKARQRRRRARPVSTIHKPCGSHRVLPSDGR